MKSAIAADSCTILQAHKVDAVTLIEDGDGSTGVFHNVSAKRLGTLIPDGADAQRQSAWYESRAFWLGVLFGFSWAATIAITLCRHWLPLHA